MVGISSNTKVYSDTHEIAELKNQGKNYLCFRNTNVKYHVQLGIRGKLKLSIHKLITDHSFDIL